MVLQPALCCLAAPGKGFFDVLDLNFMLKVMPSPPPSPHCFFSARQLQCNAKHGKAQPFPVLEALQARHNRLLLLIPASPAPTSSTSGSAPGCSSDAHHGSWLPATSPNPRPPAPPPGHPAALLLLLAAAPMPTMAPGHPLPLPVGQERQWAAELWPGAAVLWGGQRWCWWA